MRMLLLFFEWRHALLVVLLWMFIQQGPYVYQVSLMKSWTVSTQNISSARIFQCIIFAFFTYLLSVFECYIDRKMFTGNTLATIPV